MKTWGPDLCWGSNSGQGILERPELVDVSGPLRLPLRSQFPRAWFVRKESEEENSETTNCLTKTQVVVSICQALF